MKKNESHQIHRSVITNSSSRIYTTPCDVIHELHPIKIFLRLPDSPSSQYVISAMKMGCICCSSCNWDWLFRHFFHRFILASLILAFTQSSDSAMSQPTVRSTPRRASGVSGTPKFQSISYSKADRMKQKSRIFWQMWRQKVAYDAGTCPSVSQWAISPPSSNPKCSRVLCQACETFVRVSLPSSLSYFWLIH